MSEDLHSTNVDPDEADELPEGSDGREAENAEAAAGEAAAEGDGGEAVEAEEEEILDPLEKAEREATEWRDRAMRTQAELENFRKRMTRERGEAIQYANARLIEDLLPVLDNFEMGLKAAKMESEESMIYQGMNMVHSQTQDFLRDHGVVAIDSVGKAFDPTCHEAVEQQFSDEVEEGHVIAELRRGFRMAERLLRAANVIVSKGPDKGEGDQAATEPEEGS